MAKPYNAFAPNAQRPVMSPRDQKAADEKRRRELIAEADTIRARKEEQAATDLRRQEYKRIEGIDWGQYKPKVGYVDVYTTPEPTQLPMPGARGVGDGKGGPEGPTPRWATAPVVDETDTPQTPAGKPKWMQAPEVDAPAKPVDNITAMIDEAAGMYPGGYDKWRADSGLAPRVADPLSPTGFAPPGSPTLDQSKYRRVEVSPGVTRLEATQSQDTRDEKPWNEQIADILGAGVDFLFEPINSRQIEAGKDPLAALSKGLAEPMVRMPEALVRDPVKFEDDFNPVKQAGRASINFGDAVEAGVKGDFGTASKELYDAAIEGGNAVLAVAGVRGPKARAPRLASAAFDETGAPQVTQRPMPFKDAQREAALTNVPSAPVPPPQAPVREPTVREARRTLAAVAVPNRVIRPQALRAIERILTNSNIPRDRIASGLTRIVEGLQRGPDSPGLARATVAQLLQREFGEEFPQVIDNINTVVRERGLTRKRGDASPTMVRETAQELRTTQAPFIEESAARNLGDAQARTGVETARTSQVPRLITAGNRAFGPAARTGTREQIEARLRQIGQEGYEPILRQAVDDQHAEDIIHILHGPQMERLMSPLREIAAGDGIDLDFMIANDPVRAAHWMQHRARVLSESYARDPTTRALSNAFDRLRSRILGEIDDITGPDGRTYRKIRAEYGDEFLTQRALNAGDNFGAAVANPEGMDSFINAYREMSLPQQQAALASIRDWMFARLRGGQEDAPARIDALTQRGTLDALDRLGPEGRAFADELRAVRAENASLATIDNAGTSFATLATSPERMMETIAAYGNMSPEQQGLFLGAVRDWVQGKLRGGPEDTPARIAELSKAGVIDALERLGPRGQSLADDLRAIRGENEFLGATTNYRQSATMPNAVALESGPDIYSRGAASTGLASAAADAGLMASGLSSAPIITAMKQGPKLYKGMMQPRVATREDMTRVLTARPGSRAGATPQAPASPPTGRGGGSRPPVVTREEQAVLMEEYNRPELEGTGLGESTAGPNRSGPSKRMSLKDAAPEVAMGGLGATYGTFAPLQDMDGDGDKDAEDRAKMIMAYGTGGLGTAGALRLGAKMLSVPRGRMSTGLGEVPIMRNGASPGRSAPESDPVGFKNGREGRKPDAPRVDFDPRDLVLARNEKDGTYADTGIALGMNPDDPKITQTISTLVQNTRKEIERAGTGAGLDRLAKRWNVDRTELEQFMVRQQKNPNKGSVEAMLAKAADIVEKSARNGDVVTLEALTDRLRAAGHEFTQGSIESLMSRARTGRPGGHAISDEVQARIQALPKLTRKDYERRSDDIHANSMFGGGRRGNSDAMPDFIEDATQENLVAAQKAALARREVPPVFKTFRMPDGRIIAWNGDESRGGMSHAEAREVFGLGNARLEHGQFKWGDDLSRTNWYDVTGEGKAPRSVEREVKAGAREGKSADDVMMDMTPEEWVRDLRSVGAAGPANRVSDYPYRRNLATQRDIVNKGDTVEWKTPSGETAKVNFETHPEFGVDYVRFKLNERTKNDGTTYIPQAEAKAILEKAMSVFEREVIKRDKDVYVLNGDTPAHNRFYANATQRLGAPQGYVAVFDRDNAYFAFLKKAKFDEGVAAGKYKPSQWTIIPSKRGAKPVPEWRVRTGQFGLPIATGLGGVAYGLQEADADRR